MELIIGGRNVSNDTPALIIAEAGINHDGKLEQAFKLIDMAAEAGADVVKFQLFTAKYMYPRTAGNFTTANGKDVDIYDLIEDVELPEEWIPQLIERCKDRNIGFLCTTCDEISTDILSKYNVDAFKIASSEITHLPLLTYTAKKMKTMLVSEGASTLRDVADAIDAIKATGNNQIGLMHCTAEYPAEISDCNINVIETYRRIFPDLIIGFSDHTMPVSSAPIQAIKKGAKIIEKHITLDKQLPGADHCYALEADELKKLVSDIRYAESHMDEIQEDIVISGKCNKEVLAGEEFEHKFIHRGIFALVDLKKGQILTKDNIAVLRPGNSENGIEPRYYDVLLTHKVRVNKDITASMPIKWEDVLNIEL
jgi:N-acetylneuraminate synthase